MTRPSTPTDEVFDDLDEQLRGTVLGPADEGYDDARRVWNDRIDREPAAIACCRGAADVASAITFARETELGLSIKSGGHHLSGAAVRDGGLVIDVGALDEIRVNPAAKTAQVGPGATWRDLDHETQAFGLAMPGGQDPTIGVSGLTLGGGAGWLGPKYGLTVDNLLAADVVTADGALVRASEEINSDLFWALRGGGGNFGVVTSFEFQLHSFGPEVYGGRLVFPHDATEAVAMQYEEFCRSAPDDVNLLFGSMELPPMSYYPERLHNTRVAMIVAMYPGPAEEGEAALAPLREIDHLDHDTLQERTYREVQEMGATEQRMRADARFMHLTSLSEEAADTLVNCVEAAPSGGCTAFVSPRRGAVLERPTDATAYPHREFGHSLLIEARWTDPDADDEHIDWVRNWFQAMQHVTATGAYINFLTAEEKDRREAAFGANYDRLVDIKTEWDPENVFCMHPNIEPHSGR